MTRGGGWPAVVAVLLLMLNKQPLLMCCCSCSRAYSADMRAGALCACSLAAWQADPLVAGRLVHANSNL